MSADDSYDTCDGCGCSGYYHTVVGAGLLCDTCYEEWVEEQEDRYGGEPDDDL